MLGLIVRLLAYAALVAALIVEFGDYDMPNLSGALFFGGAGTLLVLAFWRAFKTRGKFGPRDE